MAGAVPIALRFRVQTQHTCDVLGRCLLHCKRMCWAGIQLFVFFGCLVAGSTVEGSRAQGRHARHWRCARAQRRGRTRINSLSCFFGRHLLWRLGNGAAEPKPICVRPSLRFNLPDCGCHGPESTAMTDDSCLGGEDRSSLAVVICGTKTTTTRMTPNTWMKPPKTKMKPG